MHWPLRGSTGAETAAATTVGKADHLSALITLLLFINRQQNTYNYHLFIRHPFIRLLLFFQLVARFVDRTDGRTIEEQLQHLWRLIV